MQFTINNDEGRGQFANGYDKCMGQLTGENYNA